MPKPKAKPLTFDPKVVHVLVIWCAIPESTDLYVIPLHVLEAGDGSGSLESNLDRVLKAHCHYINTVAISDPKYCEGEPHAGSLRQYKYESQLPLRANIATTVLCGFIL